jgi:periplasmic divalent cation tolerance protein
MIFLYITCKNMDEARAIAKAVIEKKVAGCVNIFPVQSIYQDDGGAKEVSEVSLLVKTSDSKVQDVEDLVRGLHSYKTPCIASLSLWRLNREYKEWLVGQLA